MNVHEVYETNSNNYSDLVKFIEKENLNNKPLYIYLINNEANNSFLEITAFKIKTNVSESVVYYPSNQYSSYFVFNQETLGLLQFIDYSKVKRIFIKKF